MDASLLGSSQADQCCSSTVCKLAGTALVAIAGIMCHVGACLYNGNAMPLLILIAYFCTPFPTVVCNICDSGTDPYSNTTGPSMIKLWGKFWTAFIGSSMIGIPAVLAHEGSLDKMAMLLVFAGTGLLILSLLLLARLSGQGNRYDAGSSGWSSGLGH